MLLTIRKTFALVLTFFQTEQKVYPDLANEISVTGAAGAWAEGSYAEVTSTTATDKFTNLKGVEVVSITGLHQLTIATGDAGSEVDKATLPVSAVGFYPLSADIIPAGSRIAAKSASKAGGSQAVAIKLVYTES